MLADSATERNDLKPCSRLLLSDLSHVRWQHNLVRLELVQITAGLQLQHADCLSGSLPVGAQ